MMDLPTHPGAAEFDLSGYLRCQTWRFMVNTMFDADGVVYGFVHAAPFLIHSPFLVLPLGLSVSVEVKVSSV